MKDQNPIDHMRFYVKDNLHKAVRVRKDQVSYYMCAPTICVSIIIIMTLYAGVSDVTSNI